jgi:hypothetical protein
VKLWCDAEVVDDNDDISSGNAGRSLDRRAVRVLHQRADPAFDIVEIDDAILERAKRRY